MSAEAHAARVAITLPDGSVREYDAPTTGADVAASIGPGLAKAALAVRVDGELRDLKREISGEVALEIVTLKSEDAMGLVRHDAAHVLAQAAKELFSDIQVTIGPVIDDGFFYDFSRSEPFTLDDLEKMEKRMAEIIDRDEPLAREVWDRDEAVTFFKSIGEHYKAEIISDLPDDQTITLYRQGDWLDLCRGPHLPSTGKLPKAFKLMKLAGAYWRGDSRNEMLQRVYGTAWLNKEQLQEHLTRLEEAEKRDHRKLGREMDLFHFQEETVGSVFWHDKGWRLYRTVQGYVRRRLEAEKYEEVNTPQMVARSLWEDSGHWEKFREHMFTAQTEDDRIWAMKPMNCPCHVQVFKQGIKSYRDLPLRMAEFGACLRYEPSGALHGLMRVRSFTQDDAHIFCTEEQITAETVRFCALLSSIYSDLGFEEFVVKFSDRPDERVGKDAVWDQAEGALQDAAVAAGLDLELNPGEGAFYGPKLEFVLRDAIGRDWQCGTLQVDFVLPERLDASYVAESGDRKRPVMLHRAILGSFERFIAVLLEHYAGNLPLWLAPVQFAVATVTNGSDDYAAEVHELLAKAGLHGLLDTGADKIGYKVRQHSTSKVPVILAVGKREAEERTVSIRRLGSRDQQSLALADAIHTLTNESQPPA
ncbi:MAG: threonine--tRNA ligase [Rhodospirillaceae bacterium]|jgi:threonyl-tRNA synthetase|nr:threonine--tRNA ligase [Rhodospirillaceae bacterium]MBT6511524.1 threonine--tRNA ligase [Rhodospirillaceae bacterium]MBT7615543.1 threonine--tRNA ligase [Rhodospirillaceae bacterium]